MTQRGSSAQFTYDFGIAIAQSTVSRVTKLAGASLTLASAFYALRSAADQYVNTLRENTLRFGGMLSTMKAMEQAQDRLIKGQSYFSVDDQMRGMNDLAAAGIKVGKNLDWINKAAHATGKSFSQFSGMIASAVQGNTNALVDAGLMTQRATRMFDKYAANTVMRQQAILNFIKNHKGLMNAIKNDFETVQDQMRRLQGIWQGFLQSIVGKPNDPSSLYGQIVRAMKNVADSLATNMQTIRRYGYIIGHTLGWVVKQVGAFVVWVGRVAKRAIESVWKVTDNYQEQARSIVVWLEFWKQTIVDYFQQYKGAIKAVLKLLLAYAALKYTFIIGKAAILSVNRYYWAVNRCYGVVKRLMLLQLRYMSSMGPYVGGGRKFFQSLIVYIPKPFRKAWVASGKYVAEMLGAYGVFVKNIKKTSGNIARSLISPFKVAKTIILGILGTIFNAVGTLAAAPSAILGGAHKKLFKSFLSDFLISLRVVASESGRIFSRIFGFLSGGFRVVINLVLNLPKLIGAIFNSIRVMWAALNATNPVGWIILAIAVVALLYNKWEGFRKVVNTLFKTWWEWVKFLWNLVYGIVIGVLVLIKKIWQFVNNWIIQPIVSFFKWSWNAIKTMWAAFKDSSVGRFIDKWIITPLKDLFNWILKAIRWLLKGAAAILSIINDNLAEQIRNGEKELGMSMSLAASGGHPDTDDGTNYMAKGIDAFTGMFKGKSPKEPTLSGVNPLMSSAPSVDSGLGGSGKGSTNLSFSNGAIQIVVQKGEHIDENKLARKIKETISEFVRDNNMREGTI